MPKLRCCWILVILLIAGLSCQKVQEAKPNRLIGFRDNSRHYTVLYEGNTVSQVRVDSGAGAPFVIAAYSYSPNYIQATLHPSTGFDRVEYFLRKKVLPLSIIKYRIAGGVSVIASKTDFYYRGNTDLVDSIVLQNTVKFCFIPVYTDGNISDYYLSIDNKPAVISGNFLYYPVVNVFRTTNPLLFVYSSPVFDFDSFLMPRLFSNQTMKKFNGGTFSYDTDAKGNLSVEDYGPTTFPYRRTYIYE